MEKLDRLGWVAGFSFTSYGVRIGVRCNDLSLVSRLEPLLPPGWRPVNSAPVDRLYSLLAGRPGRRPGARTLNLAYADVTRIARASSLDDVLESFESDLQLYVAQSAPKRVFVHAGVVEWSNKAIIIPGRSYSGKTTLVAELVRAGARFYSDEYAVFDERGRVHPYPKSLAVRDLSGRQQKRPPEFFGGSFGHRPIPVGLVMVSSFKSGARWRPKTASRGQGVLALLANTVAARRNPETSLNAFNRALGDALILTGTRGEAREAAASLLDAIDAAHK
jgi:hypothetical protein